jgi:two-component system chemotaxis sensor kinase CheA
MVVAIMRQTDSNPASRLLDDHWATLTSLLDAAAGVQDPMGPDPARLAPLAASLEQLSRSARQAGLDALAAVASAVAPVVAGLADGSLDPVGPAGTLFEEGTRALEEAFLSIEAEEAPDMAALQACADRILRLAAPAVPAVSPPPALATATGSFAAESWGPWEPSYPDMENDYLEEVAAHIDNLQEGLVRLSGGGSHPDLVNDLFRSSHSIKGQSGQMNARPLEKVAHKLEDVLALVRENKLSLTPTSVETLLVVIDALSSMLDQLRTTRCIQHPVGAELDRMERVILGQEPAASGSPATPPQPVAAPPVVAPQAEPVVAQPVAPQAQPLAAQPLAQPSPAAQPKPAGQPTAGKPTAEASQSSSSSKAQYLRVDFAKVDRTLNRVGDLFINKIRLNDAVDALGELPFQIDKLQNVLGRAHGTPEGDLLIAREDVARLQEGLAALEAEMERATDHLGGAMGETDMISADLRDQVMEMRMVPVDSILGRLGRVVFDALQKENRGHGPGYKRAKLEVIGADAEIDKVMANMLEVPLVHIVRNAIAHGIEPAAEREAAGKPPEGTVRIRAQQQGSRFVIETTDDGRGMDPALLGRVAIGKGLLTQEELERMTDREVLGLIFRPGFTTAEKADDLKGRGVGLDEVMDKIRTIKGSVDVSSVVGKGSRVEMSLPLTLAITTVVLGEVDTETLAIPMSAVERVVYLSEASIESMGEAEVFTLLGETVPLIRLDDLLGIGRPASKRPDSCYVTIVRLGDKRIGLALDRMGGQREVVIKSLGSLIKEVPLIAGSTLLGDRCVLILNPTEIAASLGKPMARVVAPAHAAASSKRRALLVDDDTITRLALRRIFEQAGLEVYEAADGVEGLALAQDHTFHLVSTDVVMPRMDGYELTRRLRALPALQRTPILMITSKDLEVDRRAGFEAGVDHYVTKPFERGELLQLVEEVLS